MTETILSRPELFWFILGLGLFLLELVIPGFFIFFLWSGSMGYSSGMSDRRTGYQSADNYFRSNFSSFPHCTEKNYSEEILLQQRTDESEEVEDEFTGKEAIAVSDFGGQKTGKVEFKGTTWKAESTSEIKARTKSYNH